MVPDELASPTGKCAAGRLEGSLRVASKTTSTKARRSKAKVASSRLHRAAGKLSRRSIPAAFRNTDRYFKSAYVRSSEARQNDLISRLSSRYTTDGIVLYLGAGIGHDLGFLTWRALVTELVQRVMMGKVANPKELELIEGGGDSPWPWKFNRLEKAIRKLRVDATRSLEMLGRLVARQSRGRLPSTVMSALYWNSALGEWMVEDEWPARYARGEANLDPDLLVTPLLRALADAIRSRPGVAGVRGLVNHNFDDVFDELMRSVGIPCQTIASPSDRLLPGHLACYHVHGVVKSRSFVASNAASGRRSPAPLRSGNFVFSEDQYHREYFEPYRWSNLTQTLQLGSRDGLFVGSSLSDPNIRRLLDATHRQFPDRRQYAILRRSRSLVKSGDKVDDYVFNLFESLETTAFEDMGVYVLWVDEFAQIPPLIRRVAGLPARRGKAAGEGGQRSRRDRLEH
jgi:hypothetical protein